MVVEKNNNRLREYIVISVLVVLITILGFKFYNIRKNTFTNSEPQQTWAGVPELLNLAVNTEKYKIGGSYLANPNKLNVIAGRDKKDAYSYRLTIDLLRSLTPKQVIYLQQNKPIPFTILSKLQKQSLRDIRRSKGKNQELPYVYQTNSCLSFQSLQLNGKIKYVFAWTAPTLDRKHRSVFITTIL